MWLDHVKATFGDRLDIRWRNFQLEQVNTKEAPSWKVWEQSDPTKTRSLLAAVAGEAARRQGAVIYDKFHLALLVARHGSGSRIPLNEKDPLVELAGKTGLDTDRFQVDLDDGSLRDIVGRDHLEAAGIHGIFGTPTFVFEGGNSAYLKTFIPPADKSVAFFEHFVAIMAEMSFVGELKRPQPPWPKGAVE